MRGMVGYMYGRNETDCSPLGDLMGGGTLGWRWGGGDGMDLLDR